jgi:Tfp pilus assembly protein PilV
VPPQPRWTGSAGSVLLEAIFALFLLGVVGLSLALLFTLSLRQMREVVARGEALALALELRESTATEDSQTLELSAGVLTLHPDGQLTFESAGGFSWLVLAGRGGP